MADQPKVPTKEPEGFTKMRNISDKTLQLSCDAVAPGETVDFNAAEFSTLHMFLEGVK